MIEHCPEESTLGLSIYNEQGKVLLAKGTKLSKQLLDKLKMYNVTTIYIEDELSEGIEVVESIPEQLRIETSQAIIEGFSSIAEIGSPQSKIQAMLKSARAVRTLQKVFKDIVGCLNDNKQALNLLASTKIHENYVYTHSVNVSIYACQLALENGLPLKHIEELGLGAMLHDIGKIYIAKDILNVPRRLTDEEYEHIQKHCELGYDSIRKIHELPLTVAHCALQHHERIDGSGYPRALKGNEIHKYAKIISVADVFDAYTSPRVYRAGRLPHEALELLYSGSGTHFEKKQIELFKNCIAVYPPGLTVKLSDGRTGIVSRYHFDAAGRPEVRIIKDEEGQDVTPYEINLGAHGHLTLEIVEAEALI